MDLQLDADDQALLDDLLRRQLGDLRAEISHTDDFEFKQDLKTREARIKSILARLGEGGPAAEGR